MKIRITQFFLTHLLLLFVFGVFAQGVQMEFGKNRIQYKKFDWQEYESENFVTYWYSGGKQLGKFVVQTAEKEYPVLQNTLEYRVNNKIQIVVYNDLLDFQQTNIGQEVPFYNTGGITKIVGTKVYLYFNGNHSDLQKQVKEGITRIFINQMMFGDSFQEIVQNAVLLNLPDWYTEGLVAYIGEEWNSTTDDRLRDGILSNEIESFNDLVRVDPKLAGHSLWYFIGKNYGKSTVSNLLYLTRINRSVESGFLYVLGSSFYQTTESWRDYFLQRYSQETANSTSPGDSAPLNDKRKTGTVTRAQISPKGDQVAYVKNVAGRYEVILHTLENDSEKTILKSGLRTTILTPDYGYPLIAWSGSSLIIIDQKGKRIKVSKYNKGKMTTKLLEESVQRVYSLDAISGKQIVISALRDGTVDLYLSSIEGKQLKRITRDVYDDLDAVGVTVNGKKGIVFASNRVGTNLADPGPRNYVSPQKLDLFFFDLETESPELIRISNTPFADERQPVQIDEEHFSFLSDENGVMNRYIGKLENKVLYNEQILTLNDGSKITIHEDSILTYSNSEIKNKEVKPVYGIVATSYPNSNYKQNILRQSKATMTGKLVEVIRNGGKHSVYITKIDPTKKIELSDTQFRESRNPLPQPIPETKVYENILQEIAEENKGPVEEEKNVEVPKPSPDEEDKIDIDNYFFQSEFEDDETPTLTDQEEKELEKSKEELSLLPPPPPKVVKKKKEFEPIHIAEARIKPYRTKFKTEFLKIQIDNSLIGDKMDLYSKKTFRFGDVALNSKLNEEEGLFRYPPIGILINGSMTDIMENHRFQGGIRVPTTFNGMDYFLIYENRKKRLNKEFFYYRKSKVIAFQETNGPPLNSKQVTNFTGVELNYPFNIYSSIRLTPKIRTDRNTLLATEFNVLNADPILEQRVGLKGEFIFDNTQNVSINILNGTRFKVFGEVQKPFTLKLVNDPQFKVNEGIMATFGFDARHYLRLDRFSVIATRIAGASSIGKEKILYYLGGVDNWIFPLGPERKSNTEIPVSTNGDFAYQTLVTNMRGFRNNIRNGNSYAVWNTEVRFPIFNYLSKTPVKSAFLRNFQIVSFFDMGTAWEGKSPFSKDNPLNTVYIEDPNKPITVKVNYFRDPIVMGYGFGLRSVVFGYFVRFDYAWGVETGIVQPGTVYLSLGMDF